MEEPSTYSKEEVDIIPPQLPKISQSTRYTARGAQRSRKTTAGHSRNIDPKRLLASSEENPYIQVGSVGSILDPSSLSMTMKL